jgi:hypothetical protein
LSILLAVVLTPLYSWAELPCKVESFYQTLFGKPYELPPSFPRVLKSNGRTFDLSEGSVRFLGRGKFGEVYRFTNQQQESFVFKRYFLGDFAIEIDERGLKILSEAAEQIDVSVVRLFRTDAEDIVQIDNALGLPLDTLLRKKLLSSEKMDALKAKYLTLIQNLKERVPSTQVTQSFDANALPALVGRYATGKNNQYPYTEVAIHSGNVLVDIKTLKLTIIDSR